MVDRHTGQVVNVLREDSMPRFPGYRPQLTQHIRIPAAYRAGITLFIRQEAAAFHELMNAPDLPLKVDLPQEIALHTENDGGYSRNDEEASGSCCVSHPDHKDHCGEHCSGQYNSYEYRDNNYYSTSTRISPSVSFGPGAPSLDMGVGAGAAAAAAPAPGSSNSAGSVHPQIDLPDYAGGARYFVNHGYPRQNSVYIHYFNT